MSKPLNIFLDQNHWIYLAKAFLGRPHQPGHVAVAKHLARSVERGEVRLPLSIIHLIEHSRAEKPSRREQLAEVLERFGRGWFLAPWSDILPAEICRAIALTFHSTHVPPPPNIFGHGYMFSVGHKTARSAFPEEWSKRKRELFTNFAAQPGALYDLLTFPNEEGRVRQKERISELNLRNAQAAETVRGTRKLYSEAIQKRAQLAGYTYEHQDLIRAALARIGKSFEDFIHLGINGLTEFFSRVPSLDVDCQLTLYRDRQWSRRVPSNDVNDIANLVVAMPYCNVVVIERFWARAIQETGLQDKYGTSVYTDLSQLLVLPPSKS
jgi:hypothetical protein